MMFRNVFEGSVRDHAVVTFKDPTTPGPLRRVSVDNWKIEACPHHGPSLAIAPDGSYHAAWFTGGSARQGLFYAHADNADAPFSAPRALVFARSPAGAALSCSRRRLPCIWSGRSSTARRPLVRWQVSHDERPQLERARTVAETADASDHPLLIARGGRVFLSWLTKNEGYRLIPLGEST